MSVRRLGSGLPLPASLSAAFDEWVEWLARHVPDLRSDEIEFYRRVFYSGAVAAVHQVNAGRYIQAATFLNSVIYEAEGLSEVEKIEQADAMLDGGYPWPEGYPLSSPFGIKPENR